ncbi:MAG: type III PLP-dependent enzyme [Pseudomonadota bacterium]
MANYKDAAHVAAETLPCDPVFCNRPAAARTAARWFASNFPGRTFYAVKANPSPWLLRELHEAGIAGFEAASIAEVRLVSSLLPGAAIAFMHPVKSAEAIREAYEDHGVRIFALDSADELEKILTATNAAEDLTLCLRHAAPSDHAKISLAKKFGIDGDEAVSLLQRMRQNAKTLGVAFHVGSQTMSPAAFTQAIDIVERTIVRAGVIVDVLDVGGGFPAAYPGMTPPPMRAYIDAIAERFEAMLVAENCEIWCEPGRALSAEASSLIVRVEARKGDTLYINDGVYGALFDAGHLNWPFPTRGLSAAAGEQTAAFSLYGPTCDDLDYMRGPFHLPADISVGDYFEIGVIGAYGAAMASGFNGYGDVHIDVTVDEPPMMTVFSRQNDNSAQIAPSAAKYL